MKGLLHLLLTIFALACGHGDMKTPDKAMSGFESFRSNEKFVEDMSIFYPGIADLEMRPRLTEKVNLAADDFEGVANSPQPTGEAYLTAIDKSLARFDPMELDTEDRERVALYIQELMDIVGLESSDGKLKDFVYGFQPK